MKRRGFLGLFGATVAAPFVVNAELWEHVEPPYQFPEVTTGTSVVLPGGSVYRYVQAKTLLQKGDIVCLQPGIPFGVAIGTVDKGHYGFVQVAGAASVPVRGLV